MQLPQFLYVVRLDSSVISAGLPRVTRVIMELLLLDPDCRLRKQIDAAHVIPMRMAHHDVGDFFRLHAGEFRSFVRAQIILDRPEFEPSLAMETAVEEDVVAATANQPDGIH